MEKEVFAYLQYAGGAAAFLGAIGFGIKRINDIFNSLDKYGQDMKELRANVTDIKVELGQVKTLVEVEGKHMYDKITQMNKRIDKLEDKAYGG